MVSKVLIVDDEASIRTLLRSLMAAPGLVVLEADGARDALEIASREAPFSLVVTDVLMPGMDGFELAEKLSGAGHAKDFLFISGYYDEDTLTQRRETFPSAAFLAKPFPIPDLLQAVRRVLRPDEGSGVRLSRSA